MYSLIFIDLEECLLSADIYAHHYTYLRVQATYVWPVIKSSTAPNILLVPFCFWCKLNFNGRRKHINNSYLNSYLNIHVKFYVRPFTWLQMVKCDWVKSFSFQKTFLFINFLFSYSELLDESKNSLSLDRMGKNLSLS